MSEVEYAAHCDCGAFGVSTGGTDWDRRGIEQLARRHLQNCPAEEEVDSIEIVERIGPSGKDQIGPAEETVVETVTAGVTAP